MTVRTYFALAVLTGASAGCLRHQARTDDDRSRGTMPASRTKEKTAKAEPKAPPTVVPPAFVPDEKPVVPVEFMKAPIAVPDTLAPADVAAKDAMSSGDFPRPIRNIIQRRRDERDGAAKPDPKPDDKPMLPSPYAKEKKDEGPRGVEYTTPEAAAPSPKPGAKAPSAELLAVKATYALTKQKWDALTDYEAKLVRKEVISGRDSPAEEMIFKFRKEPYSVATKNVGGVGRGRELIYVAGPGAKIHLVTGEGDNRLVGPGFYTQMSPDDRMVTSKSRHKITEGAVGRTVDLLGQAIAAAEAGKYDGLKSLGKVKRKEYADPVEGIEATIPPGQEPDLPKGGKREVYFDANPNSPAYGLPVLIRLLEGDRELEYYCFTDFKVPAHLTNADFDPARMQKRK